MNEKKIRVKLIFDKKEKKYVIKSQKKRPYMNKIQTNEKKN